MSGLHPPTQVNLSQRRSTSGESPWLGLKRKYASIGNGSLQSRLKGPIATILIVTATDSQSRAACCGDCLVPICAWTHEGLNLCTAHKGNQMWLLPRILPGSASTFPTPASWLWLQSPL